MNSLADTSNQADRDKRVAAWEQATPLGDAWFVFGDERQKALQRDRRGTSGSIAIQRLMLSGIYGQLGAGELRAWGYQIAPTVSDGPVPIPNDVFSVSPNDQQDDCVSASGWTYERVRVTTAEAASTISEAESRKPKFNESANAQSKVGRKDTYLSSKPVLDELFAQQPSFRALSAERLLDVFNARYAEKIGTRPGQNPHISERTLRKHLQRYRTEETGTNGNNE